MCFFNSRLAYSQAQQWFLPFYKVQAYLPYNIIQTYPFYYAVNPFMAAGIYDNSSATLFYLDGNDIKNSSGTTTASIPNSLHRCSEMEFIPFQNNKSCFPSYHLFYYVESDISLLNNELKYTSLDHNGVATGSGILSQGWGGGTQGYAISKINASQKRFIYYMDGGSSGTDGLSRVEFDENFGTPFQVRSAASLPVSLGGDIITPTAIELNFQNTAIAYVGNQLSFTSPSKVGIIKLSVANGNFSSQLAISVGSPGGTNHGVQFNPTGTKLFIAHSHPTISAENGIYVYNFVFNTLSGPIAGTSSYAKSQLQCNSIQQRIVAADITGSNIVFINAATNSVISTKPYNTAAQYDGTRVLPDQIDGETYPLQPVGFGNPGGCCNSQLVIVGNDINTSINASAWWSQINNPAITSIYISGQFIVDVSGTFSGKEVSFALGSSIQVASNQTLTITDNSGTPSHLHGCGTMWNGIFANSLGANVIIQKSIIEDAIFGVFVENTGNLTATGSRFINNYISIEYNNYSSANPNNIGTCRFYSDAINTNQGQPGNPGYLLFPFAGQRGITGILTNYSNLSLKPTTGTYSNKFYNMLNGIQAYNSNLKVSNAWFSNIKNYNNLNLVIPNGKAIHSLSTDNATTYTLDVDNSANTVRIVSCGNGIWVDRTHTTNIHNNIINNTNFRAIAHNNVIPIINVLNQLNVTGNQINTSLNGIYYFDCNYTTSKTENNSIRNFTEKPLSTGISVLNSTSGANIKCSFLPTYIHNNNIKKMAAGIYSLHGSCMNIENNTIDMMAISQQHHGIWFDNAANSIVFDNIINGNAQDWRCIGTRSFLSPRIHWACNNIDQTGYAMWFDSDCNFSVVNHNKMTNYLNGIFLVNKAIIGPQYITGFQSWAAKNWWSKANLTSSENEFTTDNTVNGNDNRFYFILADPNSNTSVANMNCDLSGSQFTSSSFGLTNSFLKLEATAQNSIPDTNSGCQNGGGGIVPIKTIQAFRSGDVLNVSFSSFYPGEHGWMYKNNLLRSYGLIEDSLTVNSPPDSVINYMQAIKNSNVGLLDSVETLLSLGLYSNAQALNTTCGASCNYSLKLQEANNLLIPIWEHYAATDTLVVDLATLQQITDIGNLCLIEYGDAVLKARVFIHHFIDPFLEFYHPCEDPLGMNERSETTNAPVNEKEIENTYLLYPNPTNGSANLYSSSNHLIQYTVMDINGRVQQNGKFTGYINVQVYEWNAGIYFVRLTDSITGLSKTFKLIVTK